MIIDTKNVLNKDKRKKIVFSNHSVLYILLEDKIYSLEDGMPGMDQHTQFRTINIMISTKNSY